jgi:hypothetical protein
VHSYVTMRSTVGVMGILVPLVLIIDEVVLSGLTRITVRGSISAYYHSPMQDFFVASLCIIAFLLMTYMGGHPQTPRLLVQLAGGRVPVGCCVLSDVAQPQQGGAFMWRPGRAAAARLLTD